METIDQVKKLQNYLHSDKDFNKNKLAKLIAITSGKGGVGKTNFILNLAIAMSIRGKKVLLVDADMNLSNIDVLLGVYPEFTLANLLDDDITAEKLLLEGPRGIKILSASSGDFMIMQNQKKFQQALIQVYMDMRKEFDYILVDTGAGITDYTLDFLFPAEKIVVITTPDPTAITDAYAMIKILYFRAKNPNISLVINMVQTEEEAKNIYNKINLIVQHFLNKTVNYYGCILLDNNIKEAVREQVPLIIKRPRSTASANIHNIGITIMKEDKE